MNQYDLKKKLTMREKWGKKITMRRNLKKKKDYLNNAVVHINI